MYLRLALAATLFICKEAAENKKTCETRSLKCRSFGLLTCIKLSLLLEQWRNNCQKGLVLSAGGLPVVQPDKADQ